MNETEIKQGLKSWWEKPEGKAGKFVLITALTLGAIGVIQNLNTILTYIINVAQNTLHLMVLLGAIALILIVVTNKRFLTSMSYLFKTIMRMVTSWVIELDPIAIVKSYLETMEANIQKTAKQIGELRGVLHKLKTKHDTLTDQLNENIGLLKAAKAKLDAEPNVTSHSGNVMLYSNQIGRIEKSLKNYKGLQDKVEALLKVLQKLYENSKIIYQDTANDIAIKEDEWNAVKTANSAMKSVIKAMFGNSDQRQIMEEALTYMQDELGSKVGEMQQFLLDSESLMYNIDLQNEMNTQRGLQIVEGLEKKADSLLLTFMPAAEVPVLNTNNQNQYSFNELYKK